jgi:hypothetical protein
MERQGQRSQYSDWLLTERSGVQIPAGSIDFLLPKTVQTIAGAHQTPVQWLLGFIPRGEAAGHSSPSSVEVKMSEAISTGIFWKHHILISAACCLTVPLSHNGYLAEFCIYQAIKRHNIHFLYRCLIYMYVLLNAEKFSQKQLHVGSVENCRII